MPHVGSLRTAGWLHDVPLKTTWDCPRHSSHVTSLPHSCSLWPCMNSRVTMGTARSPFASWLLPPWSDGHMQSQPDGSESRSALSELAEALLSSGCRSMGPGCEQAGRTRASGLQGTAPTLPWGHWDQELVSEGSLALHWLRHAFVTTRGTLHLTYHHQKPQEQCKCVRIDRWLLSAPGRVPPTKAPSGRYQPPFS